MKNNFNYLPYLSTIIEPTFCEHTEFNKGISAILHIYQELNLSAEFVGSPGKRLSEIYSFIIDNDLDLRFQF